jgi:hypothetical protein
MVIGVALLLVVLAPFLLDAVDSEFGQLLALWLASVAVGYFVGYREARRGPAFAVLAGVGVGLGCWAASLAYASLLYSVADPPAGAWFIRFCIGVALVVASAALFGRAAARKRIRVDLAALASVMTIVGVVVQVLTIGQA